MQTSDDFTRAAPEGSRFDCHTTFYQQSSYGRFAHEARAGGSFGLTLLETRQDPIDMLDAAVPEVVFIRERDSAGPVGIDIGDGLGITPAQGSDVVSVVPADTEARFVVDHSHELTIAALPAPAIAQHLDEHELEPAAAFGHLYAKPSTAPRLAALLDAMWHLTRQPARAANLYLDGTVLQFLAIAAMSESALSPSAPARPEDIRIGRVIDYVEAHFGAPLTVGELSQVAGLSTSLFARTFKATTGWTVWSYVTARRAERALEMLTTTDMPIAEIAYGCGFASQAHLGTVFRARIGTTPGRVRREVGRQP